MTGVNWILGASSGIGRALALALTARGETVAISARRAGALAEVAGCASGLHAFPADARDPEALREVVTAIETGLGPIHRAFLNLGDYEPEALGTLASGLHERLMATNYLGVVNGMAAVLPGMRLRRAGELYITASAAGYRGLPNASAYGVTKAALIHLAECARLELAGDGIAVRVINPGFVRTPLTDKNRFSMPGLLSPEAAASRIVAALPGHGFEIAFPRRLVWPLKLLRVLPYALYFPLVGRMTRG